MNLGTTTMPKKRNQKSEKKETSPPVNIIVAENVQVGNYNVMVPQKEQIVRESSIDDYHADEQHAKSYAEAVTGIRRTSDKNIKVQIPNQVSEDKKRFFSQTRKSNIGLFLDKVHNFERGHFVLITGEQSILDGIDILAHINWTAVFDFDPHSRSKGLLSRLEPTIERIRSLHVGSIQDTFSFSDQKTNWIFFRGSEDRPDTRMSDDYSEWKKSSHVYVDDKLTILKQFASVFTHFTFIVLWPKSHMSVLCMHFVLNRICTIVDSSVLILDTGDTKSDFSVRKLEDLNDNSEVSILELGILEMCSSCASVLKTNENDNNCYRLPMEDGPLRIKDDKVQWLKEDLHVLYLDDFKCSKFSTEQLKNLMDDFRKGGTLAWELLYAGGAGLADIERDVMQKIKRCLKNSYIKKREPGLVTILHEPGAGGTTLGRKLLWDLKEETTCVEIKQEYATHVTDQVEKLAFLGDMTNAPIVVLIDGDDEIRVKKLQRVAKRFEGLCLIILYVRRSTPIESRIVSGKDLEFYLKGELSEKEAKLLVLKCEELKMDNRRLKNVKKLIEDVQNNESKTIFEFGLAAHSFQYTGIQSYVLNHLQMTSHDPEGELENWQKALVYMSLVYFYGHSSVPCHFFTDMLAKTGTEHILQVADFPQEMKELIVPGGTDKKMYTARISHFYVAKEILEQVLLRARPNIQRSLSPFLCNEARRLLSSVSTEFISDALNRNNGNVSDVMIRMMIDTFIRRNIKELPDDETTAHRNKRNACKPLFSHILEDAGPEPPYTERFEILKKLADGFPNVPQFRAHLGRLFMICRPEKENEAEKNFDEAYEKSMTINCNIDEIPFHKRNEIRNICHMYGKMVSRKVFKYSGRFDYDRPVIQTPGDQFKVRVTELHKYVLKACELFEKCREITSPGYEECNGYMDEIHVRLAFCRFIEENRPSNDLSLSDTNENVAQFFDDCDRTILNLFEELYDMCEFCNNEKVQRLQEMYKKVMCSEKASCRLPISAQDNPASRRSEIAKIKNDYFGKGSLKYLENLHDEDKITHIVRLCEKNFKTCPEDDLSLDIDHREWIRAIRHSSYPGTESVEKVYGQVRYWYNLAHKKACNKGKQTVARFYYFVLSSLMGFGTTEDQGNAELLKQALDLKDEVIINAKISQNGDCRCEWLGIGGSFKERLIEGNRWNSTVDKTLEELVEIRVGTILRPNNRDTSGHIELFIGEANKESVRVYYVPKKWKTNGRSYAGQRVQFLVQFNMKHGFEAFNVKEVIRTKCATKGCGNNIETRSCDKEVTCGKCLCTTTV